MCSSPAPAARLATADRRARRRRRPRHRDARRRAARSDHRAARSIARSSDRSSTAAVLERMIAEFEVELDLPSRRAALDARRVHAGLGASGQRRGHARTCSSSRSTRRSRTAGRSSSSTRRRSRPTGCRIVETKTARRPGHARTSTTHPTTMYGCNKLYCEQLGHYYARHYKQLAAGAASGRVDFRCVRFPGPDFGGDDAVRRHVGLRARDDPRRGARASPTPASSAPTRASRSWRCPTASRRC